eukprot:44282-Pleurochrysis_carterae.AAC.3
MRAACARTTYGTTHAHAVERARTYRCTCGLSAHARHAWGRTDGVRAYKSRAHVRCARTRMPDESACGAGRGGGVRAAERDGVGDNADEDGVDDGRRRRHGRWRRRRQG